jgi:hypothetical protein
VVEKVFCDLLNSQKVLRYAFRHCSFPKKMLAMPPFNRGTVPANRGAAGGTEILEKTPVA